MTEELTEATRPWGRWEVLYQGTAKDGNKYKVKVLIILPRGSISLQYHNHRSEHWTIVSGKAQVTKGNSTFVAVQGDNFSFEEREHHKVLNVSQTDNLVAIEVQYGSMVREDDIVRL